jgi:trans-aconitate methyltransferase
VFFLEKNMSATQKGHFIIVNFFDNCYYDVFLDGEFIFDTYKHNYASELFSYKNVKAWIKQTGLEPESFRYSYLDIYEHGNLIEDEDYHMDDYREDLNKILSLNLPFTLTEVDDEKIRSFTSYLTGEDY